MVRMKRASDSWRAGGVHNGHFLKIGKILSSYIRYDDGTSCLFRAHAAQETRRPKEEEDADQARTHSKKWVCVLGVPRPSYPERASVGWDRWSVGFHRGAQFGIDDNVINFENVLLALVHPLLHCSIRV